MQTGARCPSSTAATFSNAKIGLNYLDLYILREYSTSGDREGLLLVRRPIISEKAVSDLVRRKKTSTPDATQQLRPYEPWTKFVVYPLIDAPQNPI